MKYKNGEDAKVGDVIRWDCWDSDDFIQWTFMGLVKTNGILYLGGGIDFGSAIGNIYSQEEVILESENNDNPGIEKIGVSSDLVGYISNFDLAMSAPKE